MVVERDLENLRQELAQRPKAPEPTTDPKLIQALDAFLKWSQENPDASILKVVLLDEAGLLVTGQAIQREINEGVRTKPERPPVEEAEGS